MSQKKTQCNRAAAAPQSPMAALPTLQRNALCKLFERPNFTPQEVAGLGYRRLNKVEGIGRKGLEIIIAWLRDWGCELDPAETADTGQRRREKLRAELRQALRILRASGYVVHRRQ